ncbi:hypothetical protein WH47_06875 [Habropoda laboriosa]|uniref:Uncharacterized protein n=1 Tax=Habropoda laboriosa TaxID=597456 RepID=A0A0L7QQ23_9HYME|nr:hypothetical protein WH47_06875 [Habropoda laboriosa]
MPYVAQGIYIVDGQFRLSDKDLRSIVLFYFLLTLLVFGIVLLAVSFVFSSQGRKLNP